MSREEARGYIQAAQEAELGGRPEDAANMLQRAAALFTRMGQHRRVVALLQHALRLQPSRKVLHNLLAQAVERLQDVEESSEPAAAIDMSPELAAALAEATGNAPPAPSQPRPPSQPPSPLVPVPVVSEPTPVSAPEAHAEGHLELPGAGRTLSAEHLVRVPVLAPAELEAWCSFCCRPKAEIGQVVQGPAGAFICRSCANLAVGLLGGPQSAPHATEVVAPQAEARVSVTGQAGPREVRGAPTPARSPEWVGPEVVRVLAGRALSGRGPSLVLVGGEGCGKTALLRLLQKQARHINFLDGRADTRLVGMGPVLLDHLESATPGLLAQLEGRPFVAALRGAGGAVTPPPGVDPSGELKLSTELLPVGLPLALAVALPPPGERELRRVLEQWLQDERRTLSPDLAESLVARAVAGKRGAKGLLAELGLLQALSGSGGRP